MSKITVSGPNWRTFIFVVLAFILGGGTVGTAVKVNSTGPLWDKGTEIEIEIEILDNEKDSLVFAASPNGGVVEGKKLYRAVVRPATEQ